VTHGRREFLRASAGLAAILAGCAPSGAARGDTLDLDPHLVPGAVSGRRAAGLLPFNATFAGHLRRLAYNVDQRVWHLWQRLHGVRHPFHPPTAARHRMR
jgi:hypothetical protein